MDRQCSLSNDDRQCLQSADPPKQRRSAGTIVYNEKAQRGALTMFLFSSLLHREAKMVDINVRLLGDHKVRWAQN